MINQEKYIPENGEECFYSHIGREKKECTVNFVGDIYAVITTDTIKEGQLELVYLDFFPKQDKQGELEEEGMKAVRFYVNSSPNEQNWNQHRETVKALIADGWGPKNV